MILLVGASASGKTEIAKVLRRKYGMVKAITTTTREPRVGEVNGVDYFFLSKEEFLEKKENNFFVETTLYNGNYYGCGKDQVEDNKVVILDPNGLENFLKLNDPHLITFLIDVSKDIRLERMISRGDPIEKAKERLVTDEKVFKDIKNVNFKIKNEGLTLDEVSDHIYKVYIESINK